MLKSLKEIKEDLFPNETFADEATKRVKVGILLNKIIEDKELKPDADKVKEIIEERAKNYKDPQQVINYFYSDDVNNFFYKYKILVLNWLYLLYSNYWTFNLDILFRNKVFRVPKMD